MTSHDMTNVFLKIRDSIYFYINFFLVGVIALIGWNLSLGNELEFLQRIIISFLFTIFWLVCILSLNLQYQLLAASHKDIYALSSDELKNLDFYKILQSHPYNKIRFIVIVLFFIIYLITIAVIWGLASKI